MNKDIRVLSANGIQLVMTDVETSIVRDSVLADLRANLYGLNDIWLEPRDVVVDIGANIGMVSVYLERKHPGIVVHALEPVPVNYDSLVANMELNKCQGATYNLAVTGDGRDFEMIAHLASNTGGATGFLRNMNLPDHQKFTVKSTKLDDFIASLGFPKIKLLKIDCEGAEYEILKGSSLLYMVEHLSGEFHVNSRLGGERAPSDLLAHCRKWIEPAKIHVHVQRMAE